LEAKFRALIRYFAHDLPAWKIDELSGVSRPTINQLFMKLRIKIAQVCNALHLKKCEFRFHHREEDLSDRILTLLKENPL